MYKLKKGCAHQTTEVPRWEIALGYALTRLYTLFYFKAL
jgi:hypothetical protein